MEMVFFSKPNKKMEGSYVNGDREGDWFLYYNNKDNTKKEQSLFKSGKLNGQLIKWYENGNKLEEGNTKREDKMEYGHGITKLV